MLCLTTKASIKAVLVCHNETATGVTSDVSGVRRILDELGHPALLFVDRVIPWPVLTLDG